MIWVSVRRARVSSLMGVIALVALGCGSDSTQATTSSVDSTALANTPVVESVDVPSPPASFAEVEDAYAKSLEGLFVEGRSAVDQLIGNDPDALHARFDASLAADMSVEDLGAMIDSAFGQAPLTDSGTDRAFRQSSTFATYRAELGWGDDVLLVTAFFNDATEISRLDLEPLPPLPPDPADDYQSQVTFRLPFEGVWFVIMGGDTAIENHHVVAADQRHAYDIFVWKEGGTFSGDSAVNENYWAYGQRLLAPAAGTIVTAIDGLPDQVPLESTDVTNPAGNHVVIEVAEGEYLLIAHMQPGSLTVAVGDVVESGQQVGVVGNSGNTSEPHIHIHLQDQPTFNPETATGLPLEFTDYLANGMTVERGQPVADQFIATG